MNEIKSHKKKVEIKEEEQEEVVSHRRSPESKNPKPNLGRKMQYAAYAAVSTTERLINGLSSIYENIFVGRQERKFDFDKEQGLKCFDNKDHQGAIDYFSSYLESGNNGDAEVLFLLAMSYVNLEEYEKAVEYFKKAWKLNGADPDIVVELAHCLFNLEDYTEAIACFKQAIELIPDEADNYYHLGGCYEKVAQVEEAKKLYKKAIDLSPREAMYYQALGFVYENSGDHKDAIVCFKKAMDLDRNHRKAGGGLVKRKARLNPNRSKNEQIDIGHD